jgi:hypothetical protein
MGLILGLFEWWQIVLIVVLIAVLVGWKMYRNKQT